MSTQSVGRDIEAEIHDWCGDLYADPLAWVRGAFPWGEENTPLAAYREPDAWQCEFFAWLGDEITTRHFNGVDAVMPIRGAVSSGHGIGKGAVTGMLVAFLMSTRRNAKGVITANTNTQLQDKTWAAIQTWVKLGLTAHWFELNTSILYRKGFREQWKCSPQTCDPDNSEAFAGQHNVGSTSFYINDEDSNVPDIIHEVQEGGLTDGEPMQFLFGNPTRRRGAFYDIVFGGIGKRWKTWVIDARSCRFPNKQLIAEQLEDYGEDSDRFRVRVRGVPPKAEDAQFIDSGRVLEAQKRLVAVLPDEPLVAGCDLAWGGCFDGETQILTDAGWKHFAALSGEERVLTLNGDLAEWGPITQVHQYWHDGPMNLHESAKLNFCLTDNHRLYVRSHQRSARYVLKRYDALPGQYFLRDWHRWEGETRNALEFTTVKQQPHGGQMSWSLRFDPLDFATFLGWFVAEGNVHLAPPRKGKPYPQRVIELSQRQHAKRRRIETLCARMGIKLSQWSAHGTTRFTHQALGDWLRAECGHGASQKRMPAWVRDATPEILRAFLDAYRAGDGTERISGHGRCYMTSSHQLADDIHEALAKLGVAGKLSSGAQAGSTFVIDGRTATRRSNMWVVYEKAAMPPESGLGRDREVHKKQTARVDYHGWVWCVSTPHQTIYVRRKGVPMWSGNSDANVIRFRRGRDARSIPPIRIPGELTRDPSVLTNRLADVLSGLYDGSKVAMLFLDSAGIAGAVGTRLRALGHTNLLEVNFGADSPNQKMRYMRDFMWAQMKDWLLTGAIDKSPRLESDLTGPGLRDDLQQRIWLESKKEMRARDVPSPDEGDALALTFAQIVAPPKQHQTRGWLPNAASWAG